MPNILLSLAFLGHVVAAPVCPPPTLSVQILALGSVYIGEIHGTNESPRLVECLVDASLKASTLPLAVSLELPPDALDPKARFWNEDGDGRASQAMFDLVAYVKEQQHKGRLTIHFQTLPGDGRSADNDERAGKEIAELAAHGRVIALSGNFHSRHSAAGSEPAVRPTGDFVGPKVQSVAVFANGGGTIWACIDNVCGIHRIPKLERARPAYTLIDGSSVNHQWILAIDSYSASSPEAQRTAATN